MAEHINFCPSCKRYTMELTCPKCSGKAETSKPPKYSPDDKYAEMKRKAKTEDYTERNFL